MSYEGFPSLFSLDLSPSPATDHSSLGRWLAGSFVLHIVVALLALNLRFTPTIEQPLSSYEVSLVSLPASKPVTPPKTKSKVASKKPSQKPKTEKASAKPKAKQAPSPPKRKAKAVKPAPKAQAKQVPPPAKPEEKPLPPLSTQMASERLSESFSGAAKSVVVPEKLTGQTPVQPIAAVKTSPGSSQALENIQLPPKAPSLTPVKPLAPADPVKVPEAPSQTPPTPSPTPTIPPSPKTTPPTKTVDVQQKLKEIKTPPKAPTLAPAQPFAKTEEVEPSPSTLEPLSQPLRENIQSVKIPIYPQKRDRKPTKRPEERTALPPPPTPVVPEAPQLAKAAPPKKEEPLLPETRERLSESLKHVLESVKMPQLRDTRKSDPVQSPTTEASEPTPNRPDNDMKDMAVSEKFRAEIDEQLAKLRVPDVTPVESIRTRLQIQEATSASSETEQSGATSQSLRDSKGQNHYLALVQEQIDRQWVAPPVGANDKNLQVVLTFRILQSGKVIDLDIEEGSGNSYYDSAAIRAVHSASPLPPFTPEISGTFLDVTIAFKVEKDAS